MCNCGNPGIMGPCALTGQNIAALAAVMSRPDYPGSPFFGCHGHPHYPGGHPGYPGLPPGGQCPPPYRPPMTHGPCYFPQNPRFPVITSADVNVTADASVHFGNPAAQVGAAIAGALGRFAAGMNGGGILPG